MLSNAEIQGGTLPLTDEESAMLKLIYRTRLKVFLPAYAILLLIAFKSGMAIDGSDKYGHRYVYNPKETGLSRMQMYEVTIPLMELFVVTTGIVFSGNGYGRYKKTFEIM